MNKTDIKWIDEVVVYKSCPKCKIGHLTDRVSRNPIVRLLLADLKLYKCDSCGATTYAKTNILST